MKKPIGVLLLLGAMAWGGPAAAEVIVAFVKPERFADAGTYARDSGKNLQEIEEHLKRLGDRYLARDQKLTIEVLDIKLAGTDRYNARTLPDLRVLTGRADWPSIKVRYTLQTDQTTDPVREETIQDLSYLDRRIAADSTQRLLYEKRMLDEWFRDRFASRRSAQ